MGRASALGRRFRAPKPISWCVGRAEIIPFPLLSDICRFSLEGERDVARRVDDFEVTDLRVLTLGNKVPAEGNVLRALPEACLLREGNSCFAVFVDDSRAVLMKAHFEFAKEETFF